VRAVPRLCELYPCICLTTEGEKTRKNLSQGRDFSQGSLSLQIWQLKFCSNIYATFRYCNKTSWLQAVQDVSLHIRTRDISKLYVSAYPYIVFKSVSLLWHDFHAYVNFTHVLYSFCEVYYRKRELHHTCCWRNNNRQSQLSMNV